MLLFLSFLLPAFFIHTLSSSCPFTHNVLLHYPEYNTVKSYTSSIHTLIAEAIQYPYRPHLILPSQCQTQPKKTPSSQSNTTHPTNLPPTPQKKSLEISNPRRTFKPYDVNGKLEANLARYVCSSFPFLRSLLPSSFAPFPSHLFFLIFVPSARLQMG